MLSIKECRVIEVWNPKVNSWVPAHMENLAPGDIFRMWERETGAAVSDNNGNTIFKCAGPAIVNCDPYSGPLPREESILT